jgi:BolA protein
MSLTTDQLQEIIFARIPSQHVYVEDMSGGCGQAFAVIIVSDEFQGKNKLARSRLINTLLKQEIAGIHAFTQKNFTSEEWQVQKVNFNV